MSRTKRTKPKKARTKRILSDDAKYSRIEKWLVKNGHSKDKAKDLIGKYGMYAYDLMLAAQMRPYKLELKDGKSAGNTRQTVDYILNNDIPLSDLEKITGVDANKMTSDIMAFNAEGAIPTVLPVSEKDATDVQSKKTKTDEKADDKKKDKSSKEENKVSEKKDETVQETTQEADYSLDVSAVEEAWIEQQIQKLKGKSGGEISFAALQHSGVSAGAMKSAMSPDMVSHVHAGAKSIKMAKAAPRIDEQMSHSGNCLSAIQINIAQTLGLIYGNFAPPKIDGKGYNSASQAHLAWERSGEFAVFDFPNDHRNPYLCSPGPCEGAIVSFGIASGCNATRDGHIAMMGMDRKTYYCDWKQDSKEFACGSRKNGQPYGDVHIAFTKDCTVSDELARKMLHQQYLQNQNMLAMNYSRGSERA